MQLENQFLKLIPQLGLEMYLGVSALLCADATNFTDNLEQVLTNFKKLPRKSKRELIRVMRAAIKEETKNGTQSDS